MIHRNPNHYFHNWPDPTPKDQYADMEPKGYLLRMLILFCLGPGPKNILNFSWVFGQGSFIRKNIMATWLNHIGDNAFPSMAEMWKRSQMKKQNDSKIYHCKKCNYLYQNSVIICLIVCVFWALSLEIPYLNEFWIFQLMEEKYCKNILEEPIKRKPLEKKRELSHKNNFY